MEIKIPSISSQQRFVLEAASKEAIKQLQENLNATEKQGVAIGNNTKHLLTEEQGWEAPSAEVVRAYFENFKEHFPEYDSDKKLAKLFGLKTDRRIREFKSGEYKVPYGVWRKFLVLTGRAPQEVIPVLAIFNDK